MPESVKRLSLSAQLWSHRPSSFEQSLNVADEGTRANPLLPLLLAFRVMGRIPVTRHNSGRLYFKACSWPMFYCIVVTVAQLAMAAYTFRWRLLRPHLWADFDAIVGSIMDLLILVNVVYPVIFTWRETPSIARAVNRWEYLQKSFKSLAGLPISSPILDHPYLGILLATIFSIFVEYLPVLITSNKNIFKDTIYAVTVHYLTMLPWYWIVFTHLTSRMAELFKDSLVKTIAGNPSVERLRMHRTLWLELQSFTTELTDCVSGTVGAWETLMMLSLVLSLYATATAFINSHPVRPGVIIPVLRSSLHIFILHNASYLADHKLGRDVMVGMMSCNFRKFSEDQLNEIELLLYAIENSEKRFVMKGMVEFTRSSILDIIESTLTFLVVLVQFKTSA